MEVERISLKFQILFEREREREKKNAKKKLFLVGKLHGVRFEKMKNVWK